METLIINVPRKLCAVLLGILLVGGCSSPPPADTGSAARAAPVAGAPSSLGTAEPEMSAADGTVHNTVRARPDPLSPPVLVRVGHQPNGANAGIYIALARGYFAAEGLDLRLEPFDTGEQLLPAVATGQVDVSAGAIGAGLFNALARGVSMKIVAGQVVNEPGLPNGPGLVIRKDLFDAGRVRDYSDLRGLRIGTGGASTAGGPVFARLLTLGGLQERDVDVTELAPADLATALINDGLDAVMVTEPFVTRSVQAGAGVRWKSFGDIYPHQQATVLLYSPEFSQRQPDAASRFLVAYLQGVRDYVATMQDGGDRTPIYEILAEYTALKDLRLYATLAPAALQPDGTLSVESLQADQEFWVGRGLIPQAADLASAIDLQYLEAARRQLDGSR